MHNAHNFVAPVLLSVRSWRGNSAGVAKHGGVSSSSTTPPESPMLRFCKFHMAVREEWGELEHRKGRPAATEWAAQQRKGGRRVTHPRLGALVLKRDALWFALVGRRATVRHRLIHTREVLVAHLCKPYR
jgi:hypothetical protein